MPRLRVLFISEVTPPALLLHPAERFERARSLRSGAKRRDWYRLGNQGLVRALCT
jgi:hypothetical protein